MPAGSAGALPVVALALSEQASDCPIACGSILDAARLVTIMSVALRAVSLAVSGAVKRRWTMRFGMPRWRYWTASPSGAICTLSCERGWPCRRTL